MLFLVSSFLAAASAEGFNTIQTLPVVERKASGEIIVQEVPKLQEALGRCMAHGEAQFLCMGIKTEAKCVHRGCYWKHLETELQGGGDLDEHGCKPSTGYQWCEAHQSCERSFETECPETELQEAAGRCAARGEGQFLCMGAKSEDECAHLSRRHGGSACHWIKFSEETELQGHKGGDLDEHGCKPSTGYFWCEAHQACERSFEIECPETMTCETCYNRQAQGENIACIEGENCVVSEVLQVITEPKPSCGECNGLGYHDRVACCSENGNSCKFLEAYYPTRPQGLCVTEKLESGGSVDELQSGGSVDEHGCKPSTGHFWCEVHQACEKPWEVACPKTELEAPTGRCMARGEAQFLCMHLAEEECGHRGLCHWHKYKTELEAPTGRCMARGEAQFLCMHLAEEECGHRGLCHWHKYETELESGGHIDEHGCHLPWGEFWCEAHQACQMWNTECPKTELEAPNGRCMARGEAQFLCMHLAEEECGHRALCHWHKYETELQGHKGGDVDEHGCKPSTGYFWCEAHQACERSFEIPCPVKAPLPVTFEE